MKTLYLIRHAKSSWKYPALRDEERPLNKRGQENAPDMGKRLKKRGVIPDLLVSSHAQRAFDTANLMADALGYSKRQIIVDKRLYHAATADFMKVIGEQNNKVESLLVFGHNPGLTTLANTLCDEYLDNIVTAGVYAIRFDVKRWRDIPDVQGEFLFYDYPKKGKN
jgi:phosphohistidine phosphatase